MKTNFFLTILLLSLSFQAFSEENTIESENKFPMTYEASKTISTGRYMGGGAASFILGWGLGHAIQGRYSERGWIFTAGGALVTLGSVGLLISTVNDKKSGSKTNLSVSSYFLAIATLVGSGLRVWELIDIWLLPSSYKVVKESPFEVKPLAFYDPNTSLNYGLSFKYQF